MNDLLTAIIVEDEEFPRLSLLEKLKRYHPGIRVADMCDDCDAALESVLKHRPDILFLDIELPGKNSLWLLERLEEVSSLPLPYPIFTTAFNDPAYLLKAIRLEAVDYLLKPVALDELAKAIQKVRQKIAERTFTNGPEPENERSFTFRTFQTILKVKASDLIYCEADGYCSRIFLSNNLSELVSEHLKDIENKVCGGQIIRAGRKYIVNSRYLYKLDTKKNICYFRLPGSGEIVDINLSEAGMEAVLPFVGNSGDVRPK